VNFDSTRNRIVLHIMDKEKSGEGTEPPPSLLERTPADVSQVWITTRVAGSATVNLRTGTGEVWPKYLPSGLHV
jgi:protein FRG1